MNRILRACPAALVPFLASAFLAACGGGSGTPGSAGNTSPPVVSLRAETLVGPTSATLNGNVSPNGLPTECWFEFGTDPTLATHDDTARLSANPGADSQSVSCTVTGLASGTTYWYRFCASNVLGTTRSPGTGFTTRRCLDCHGGVDGGQPAVNGAPVVTRYWRTSGHGRTVTGAPPRCDDCHDVDAPAGTHATDGSGMFNTLVWPGKPDDTTNTNTAHLRDIFFPVSPVAASDYALAFDNACGNRAGCHARADGSRVVPAMNHARSDTGDPDALMEFGTHGTAPDPKIYSWYAQTTYADDFYKSQSVWTVADLTIDAAGPPHYGTCVGCHDPHGTGTTDQKIGGGNAMLRGNWITDTGRFCNDACHRTR